MSKKLIGIIYFKGGAGGALTRILQSHKEVYWTTDWLNHDDPDITDPIQFPNNPITLRRENPNMGLSDRYYLQSAHGMPHYSFLMTRPYINKFIKDDSSQIFFYDALKDVDLICKGTCAQKNYIYCYASDNFLNKRYSTIFEEDFIKSEIDTVNRNHPVYIQRANYVVNIENLLNTDYYTFEEEYNKLITKFNLTTNISSVRAFILAWIERQSLDPTKHINY
tara:strand:+ start:293 stop:958 length:666 start_codon:yes stop_codon:yes gene_type:complete